MKLILMITGVLVVAAILLGIPYLSWLGVEDNALDMKLTLGVSARCDGYLQKATFVHTQEYDDYLRPGYTEYVWDYWTGSSGETIPEYPYLSVLIQEEYDSSSRQVWRVPYTYGETLDWSGEYVTSHGETLTIQLQIYWAQSMSSILGWKEIVP